MVDHAQGRQGLRMAGCSAALVLLRRAKQYR